MDKLQVWLVIEGGCGECGTEDTPVSAHNSAEGANAEKDALAKANRPHWFYVMCVDFKA